MTGGAAPGLDEQEHRRGIALTRQRGFGEGRGGARGRAARRRAAGRRWEPSTEREVGRRGGWRRAVAGNRRRSEDSRVVGCARRTGSDGGAEHPDRTGRRSDG